MWKTGVVWPAAVRELTWRSFVVLSSRWDLQTCWYPYKVSHILLSLTAAGLDWMCFFWMVLKIQKEKCRGLCGLFWECYALWAELDFFRGVSTAPPLPASSCCSIISQHQYDRRRLELSTTSCAVMCLHLVVGLCHTHRVGADVPDQCCTHYECWGLTYYHGQGNLWLHSSFNLEKLETVDEPGFPDKITRQRNHEEF